MKIGVCRNFGYKVISIILTLTIALGSFLSFNVPKVYACYTWQVGNRVGLKGGAEIRHGPGFGYGVHTIVPNDNWQVDIIDGPRYADGQEWWDISRQQIDGGGTGWVYKAQAGYDICGSEPTPSPGRLVLIQDLSVSTTSPTVGEQVSAWYRVKNIGGQAITLDYLGIQGRLNGDINGTARDFNWVQNLTLQSGQEYAYSSSRSFDIAGSWRLRPNYKPQGGDWSDVHRENGTINEVWLTVQNPQGNIYVASGLELQPDPNHTWPPYEDDKLIGRFTLGNDGGQTVHLEGYGVRMRRNNNPDDYWDFLNMSGRDLAPGDTVRFDQNNERPLATGHYRAEITWKVSGQDWQVSNPQEFDVTESQPGQLELVDDLSLRSDGSGAWPPQVGDKLIAHIKVRNVGDQSLHVEHIGVRGRRNGSENWDIGWWTIDLGGHQEWSLDPNNERPLQEGGYSFRISYSPDGSNWAEIGNEISFTVQQSVQPGDNAEFVSQSSYPTVPQGQSFLIWFEVRNTGTTTWNAAENYYLSNINDQSLGAPSRLELDTAIPPGTTYRWNIVMQAPSTDGTYRTQWMMMHDDNTFGPNMFIDVTISGSDSSQAPDLRVVSGPSIMPSSPGVGQQVEGTFVVRNFGSSSASVRMLGLGGRGPLGESDVEDFPLVSGISLAPGAEYTFTGYRRFTRDGAYTFFPVFQTWDGTWVEMKSSDGGSLTHYITVRRSTNPAVKSIETHYDANSREVVNVEVIPKRENPDGSMTVDIVITNKKWVALAARFYNFGAPVGTDSKGILDREYIVIMPTSGEGYGGYKIPDVKFWPDSKLHVMFTAWGTGTGSPENIHDTGVLMSLNTATLVYAYLFNDKIPSNALDGSLAVFDMILGKLAEHKSNAAWFQLGFKIGMGEIWEALDVVREMLARNPEIVVDIASCLNVYTTKEAVKGILGAPLKLILALPSLLHFAWDFGGTKWWGVSEVDMIPSTRPTGIASRVLSEGNGLATNSAVSTEAVRGNTVVASSSEFGCGWEFYTLVDGNYHTGWGNGSNTEIDDQWVTIRLANGRPVTINQIRIHPGSTGGDPVELALKRFRVDSSLDGVNFAPLLQGEFSSSEVGSPKTFSVQPTLANYLKFHALSNQGGEQGGLLSVAELEVFGEAGLAGDMFEPDSDFRLAKWMPTDGTQFEHTFSYAGDVDWIQFEAQARTSYTIQTSNLSPGADTVLELYDQDGSTLLVSNDDYGDTLASRIAWQAPADGTYYVMVKHWNPNVGGCGSSYDFSICGLFGDFSGNRVVDVADIMQVASRWRCKCGDACYAPCYDMDGDCDIDIVDIMLVVAHWGEACEPLGPYGSTFVDEFKPMLARRNNRTILNVVSAMLTPVSLVIVIGLLLSTKRDKRGQKLVMRKRTLPPH